MKTFLDNLSDWYGVCIAAAITLVVVWGMGTMANNQVADRQQWAKENPVESAKSNCLSRVAGSRPACWSEGDWIEYCKHIECKQR